MDILQFINSNAIRNHLKKINYQFYTLEAAWLIYHSYNHSVYEKFDAYAQLMQEYPDCRVKERLHTPAQDSLFKYLKNYINEYKKAIYEFEAPGSVYSIEVKHFDRETDYAVKTMFTNLDAVRKQCKIENDDENPGDIKNFVISKYIPESEKSGLCVPQQMVLKGDDLKPIYFNFQNDVGYNLLGDLCLDIPMPFKKGDIVWDKYYKFTPVVFLSICYENISNEDYIRLKKTGDETDMTYEYYCMIDSDTISRDIDYNYMDLEYYPYELTDKHKALLLISRFLKGDIDIGSCCNAFHSLSLRDCAEKSMPKRYTDKLTEESRIKKNNTYKKYIDEFMPSDEMRNYLKTQELTPYQIASLIFNSPYSIEQKKNVFYSLLSETDDSELKALCSNCIENIERAYELLNTDGTFKVTSSFVNGVVPELNDEGLFSNYKDVKEFIASDIKECEYKDYDYYGYFIEKWIKNSDGILENVITYYVIKNEICYFKYSPLGDYLKEFSHDFEPKILRFELNVPTPFKVGDVVMFDGYPFAQKRFSLILSTGDNQDCCSLWNLYWAGPRTWKTGAVKHGQVGYVLRNDFIVPPLYNAKRYDGVLPSTFKIFHEIKQAFGDDERKYENLDSIISARGITEDEIRSFINSEVDNGKL